MVVDDHQSIRKLCTTVGNSVGFDCKEAENAEAALAQLETVSPDLILADLMMANMSGLDFLQEIKRILPLTEIAIMTGHGSIETAVKAMKLGAYDYITKPFRIEEFKLLLRRMEEKVRLVTENQFLRERMNAEMDLSGIVGSSTKIEDVLRLVGRLKDTRTPVLITGESGTGKELVARAIHYRGAYANRPFVAVDCGSLVPTLIESELFGYEKGAFTGASQLKRGKIEIGNGGTVFLDEIGDISEELQAKLLRFLQEREFERVGGTQLIRVDVRIIAATNRNLETAVKEGRFREDLFYRINVVPIVLPPLKERKEDVPALAQFFMQRFSDESKKNFAEISQEALETLLGYEWPGNVRELANVIERAVVLGQPPIIQIEDLSPGIVTPEAEINNRPTPQSYHESIDEYRREVIVNALAQAKGNRAAAARLLGLQRSYLLRLMKTFQIS